MQSGLSALQKSWKIQKAETKSQKSRVRSKVRLEDQK